MQNFLTLQQALKLQAIEYMERIETLLSSYTNNNDIYRTSSDIMQTFLGTQLIQSRKILKCRSINAWTNVS